MANVKRFGIVILTKTINESAYRLTIDCVNSIYASEKNNPDIIIDALIIESQKDFDTSKYGINSHVKTITPDTNFNFHKFLNIGITHFLKSCDFIALCNNDLIFKTGWASEIIKAGEAHPDILSFSPFDNEKGITEPFNKISFGYNVREHIAGWCIILRPELIDIIGLLDEHFDFFYADDDYAMTLRKYNIKNALVYSSHVIHLSRKNSGEVRKKEDVFFKTNLPASLPDYIRKEGYNWLLNNSKALEGHLKFHKKWGSPKSIARKNRFVKILNKTGLGFLDRYVYATNTL